MEIRRGDTMPKWNIFETRGLDYFVIVISQIFTRPRTTQGLDFKPFNSLAPAGAKYLQPKNCFKHQKQRHLVFKMKGAITQSKSFFGISTPKYTRKKILHVKHTD